MAITKEAFVTLVKNAVANNVCDIHIRTDEKPCFRLRGDLVQVKMDPLSNDDVKFICKLMIKDEEIVNHLDKIKEYDGSYAIPKLCRLRVNLMRYQDKLGLILRIINDKVPSAEDLKLPDVITEIS